MDDSWPQPHFLVHFWLIIYPLALAKFPGNITNPLAIFTAKAEINSNLAQYVRKMDLFRHVLLLWR